MTLIWRVTLWDNDIPVVYPMLNGGDALRTGLSGLSHTRFDERFIGGGVRTIGCRRWRVWRGDSSIWCYTGRCPPHCSVGLCEARAVGGCAGGCHCGASSWPAFFSQSHNRYPRLCLFGGGLLVVRGRGGRCRYRRCSGGGFSRRTGSSTGDCCGRGGDLRRLTVVVGRAAARSEADDGEGQGSNCPFHALIHTVWSEIG